MPVGPAVAEQRSEVPDSTGFQDSSAGLRRHEHPDPDGPACRSLRRPDGGWPSGSRRFHSRSPAPPANTAAGASGITSALPRSRPTTWQHQYPFPSFLVEPSRTRARYSILGAPAPAWGRRSTTNSVSVIPPEAPQLQRFSRVPAASVPDDSIADSIAPIEPDLLPPTLWGDLTEPDRSPRVHPVVQALRPSWAAPRDFPRKSSDLHSNLGGYFAHMHWGPSAVTGSWNSASTAPSVYRSGTRDWRVAKVPPFFENSADSSRNLLILLLSMAHRERIPPQFLGELLAQSGLSGHFSGVR